jgi:hypothetical protein
VSRLVLDEVEDEVDDELLDEVVEEVLLLEGELVEELEEVDEEEEELVEEVTEDEEEGDDVEVELVIVDELFVVEMPLEEEVLEELPGKAKGVVDELVGTLVELLDEEDEAVVTEEPSPDPTAEAGSRRTFDPLSAVSAKRETARATIRKVVGLNPARYW